MKVLIAEDDKVSRRLLQATLGRLGYDVMTTENGAQAWEALQQADAPRLAILDWMMPELDGVDVCRNVRQRDDVPYVYIILLTARGQKKDVVTGLEAGADDYLVKPFDPQELSSRITVGKRILELEAALDGKVHELKAALSHVKQLQGLLPICMHCKKIRDDGDTWHRVESYIEEHSDAMFTHSLCEECMAKHYPNHGKKRSTEKAGQPD
jgi:CheY-like chemotaxis protein